MVREHERAVEGVKGLKITKIYPVVKLGREEHKKDELDISQNPPISVHTSESVPSVIQW